MSDSAQVPEPAVRRLSLYLRLLQELEHRGQETVSSQKLAHPLGLTDAQVRKDLGYFGQFGRPGVGYEVSALIRRLRGIFGTDRVWRVLLVGAGSLGQAVAGYGGLRAKGFEVVAVFDTDPARIGQPIAGLEVQAMADLTPAARSLGARLGIIALPAAQEAADRLIAAGVHGIFNFAPMRVTTPPGVLVRDLDIGAELEQLTFVLNTAPAESSEQKEILIVDDSEASVVFLKQIVEDMGHRCRVARDGSEASLVMKENRPDLVLLDIMMPRKSGISVFMEMKKDPILSRVPVIIVTGATEVTGVDIKTGEETLKEADEDGIPRRFGFVLHEMLQGLTPDGLVEKPVDPDRLTRSIEEALALERSS